MNTLISNTRQQDILRAIKLNPNLQLSTKLQYCKAINNAINADIDITNADQLVTYASTLKKSSRAFLKSAIRLWGDDVAIKAKGQATPENIAAVQATVYRIEALTDAIKVEASNGQKAHTWLSGSQVKKLSKSLNTNTTQGKRDKVILGLLLGAGLRRAELSELTFDDIILQPVAGKFRMVLNIKGKGAKERAIPLNNDLASILDDWKEIVKDGNVARSITRGGAIGKDLSGVGIFHIVANNGKAIGKEGLAPHDLRRTFARLGYDAGVDIGQISMLLGHSSIKTTQTYLGIEIDLDQTVSDFVPFGQE